MRPWGSGCGWRGARVPGGAIVGTQEHDGALVELWRHNVAVVGMGQVRIAECGRMGFCGCRRLPFWTLGLSAGKIRSYKGLWEKSYSVERVYDVRVEVCVSGLEAA